MNTRTIGTIALSAAALIALGCGAGGAGSDGKPVTLPTADTSVDSATGAKPPVGQSKKFATPRPAEIKLGVKVLSRQCFGSAGCNVEFRISTLEYSGPKMDPDATYEVTFAYKGLSDPMEARLTLNGDLKFETEESQFGQTKSKNDKVTAVVTGVEKM